MEEKGQLGKEDARWDVQGTNLGFCLTQRFLVPSIHLDALNRNMKTESGDY